MKRYILGEINKDDFVNRMCEIGLGDSARVNSEISQIWNFLNGKTHDNVNNKQFGEIIRFLKTRLTSI